MSGFHSIYPALRLVADKISFGKRWNDFKMDFISKNLNLKYEWQALIEDEAGSLGRGCSLEEALPRIGGGFWA